MACMVRGFPQISLLSVGISLRFFYWRKVLSVATDVNFDVTYDGDQKNLIMCIESVFEQFWCPSYLMSKLTSICVNLVM